MAGHYPRQLGNPSRQRGYAITTINRLLDICAHPALDMESWRNITVDELIMMSPKLEKVVEILREIQVKGEKALLFTRVRKLQDILAKVILGQFGFLPKVINGASKGRWDIVKEFNKSPGFNVMIVSHQAGGIGLTITGANHVIHYIRWRKPAVINQATDRVHRFGQTRPVSVYIPVATENSLPNGTVDQVLHRLLERKEKLAESVIVPSGRLELVAEDWLTALGLDFWGAKVGTALSPSKVSRPIFR